MAAAVLKPASLRQCVLPVVAVTTGGSAFGRLSSHRSLSDVPPPRPFPMADAVTALLNEIPLHQHLGISVGDLQAGDTEITMHMKYSRHLLGDFTRPALHGGSLATLMDAAGGLAAWVQLPDLTWRVSTVDLRVDYVRPAPDTDIRCVAKVVHAGSVRGGVLLSVHGCFIHCGWLAWLFCGVGRSSPVCMCVAVTPQRLIRCDMTCTPAGEEVDGNPRSDSVLALGRATFAISRFKTGKGRIHSPRTSTEDARADDAEVWVGKPP